MFPGLKVDSASSHPGTVEVEEIAPTSHGRFMQRVEKWRKAHPATWFARHTLWWSIHNLVAHVLIGVLPFGPFFQFHDWMSKRLNNP